MLKMMKFDKKFPCSWPKQLFTIEKTKKSKQESHQAPPFLHKNNLKNPYFKNSSFWCRKA